MTFQTRRNFIGLVTAAAATGDVPGALEIADNVVIRRPGVVSPRPGAVPLSLGYTLSNGRTTHVYQARTLYEDMTGVLNSTGALLQSTFANQASFGPTRLRRDALPSAQARGNLYVGFAHGVTKIGAHNDSAWSEAGLPVHYLSFTTDSIAGTTGDILALNTQYAYRLVGLKKDSSGVVIRSRPTAPISVVGPTSGGPNVPRLLIRVRNTTLFDSIEVYRTRNFPSTVTLDDEMQLVATLPIALFPTNFTTYTYADKVADSKRGVTLYASPSRGGIEAANDRPPACGAMALYKGSIFFGDVSTVTRLVFSYNWADRTGSATGVGTRTHTATLTSGSNTLTAVSPATAGIVSGQQVRYTSGGTTYTTYVTGTTANTITVLNAPSVSGSLTVTVADTVTINGTRYALGAGGELGAAMASTSALVGAYGLASPSAGYTTTQVIESLRINDTVSVTATHGDEMNPSLASLTYGTSDTLPGGLYWSQPDEPEHVPPKNYALVGDKQKRILALTTTRDALWILKEDGVYRLSGVNGTWTVDPFDPTLVCVAPTSVRVLNGRVYALTTRGLVAFGDGGVEILSEPIREELNKVIAVLRAAGAQGAYTYSAEWGGTSNFTTLSGSISALDEPESEYLLALPTTGRGLTMIGGHVLVYNEPQRAFTTYSFDSYYEPLGIYPRGLGMSAAGRPMLLTVTGARTLAESVGLAAEFNALGDGYDAIASATSTSTDTLNVTLASGYAVRAGDVLVASGLGATRVLALVPGLGVRIERTDIAATDYTSLIRPVRARIRPYPFTDTSLTGKLWTHVVFGVTRAIGALAAEVVFQSSVPLLTDRTLNDGGTYLVPEVREAITLPRRPPPQPGDPVDSVDGSYLGQSYGGLVLHQGGSLLRALVPQVHRRAWLLRLALEWLQAAGDYRLELAAVDHTDDAPNRSDTLARASA